MMRLIPSGMLGLDSPIKISIFFTYVAAWVALYLLLYQTRRAGSPSYNVTSVVLLTEMIKLVLAIIMYISKDGDAAQMAATARKHTSLLIKYFIPALLYCVYNNLVYVNLTFFDPGTYNVLMQLRIVLTGVVYQVLFKKNLNKNQWIAVVLITLGAMIKESDKMAEGFSAAMSANLWAWSLVLMQMLCSVSAGCYNEVLLKGETDAHVTTNLQNAFMYFQSIVCNLGALCVQGQVGEAMSLDNLSAVFTREVLAVVGIMSSVGLLTGFFLEHLDSVVKAVAGAVELVLTVFLASAFFGVPLSTAGVTAALVVFCGVALYSQPVSPEKGQGLPQMELPPVGEKPPVSEKNAEEDWC